MTSPLDIGFTTYLNGFDADDPIADSPWGSLDEISRSDFGVAASPDQNLIVSLPEEIVEKTWVENYRGTAIETANDGRVWHNRCNRNYVNCKVGSSDGVVQANVFSDARDANLWVARDSGNVYISNNHCYGSRISCLVEPGNRFRSVEDTFADAMFGLFINTVNSKLIGSLFQNNKIRDAVIQGYNTKLQSPIIYVQREITLAERQISLEGYSLFDLSGFDGKAGIELDGFGLGITDGLIVLDSFYGPNIPTGNACLAGVVVRSDQTTIDGQIIDSDGLNGSTGILFRGHRRGCVIRVETDATSFVDSTSKIIRFAQGSRVDGLDALIRIPRAVKLKDIVDVQGDWSGRITVVNLNTGNIETTTN